MNILETTDYCMHEHNLKNFPEECEKGHALMAPIDRYTKTFWFVSQIAAAPDEPYPNSSDVPVPFRERDL